VRRAGEDGIQPSELRRELRCRRFKGRSLARGQELDGAIDEAVGAARIFCAKRSRKDTRGRAILRAVYVAGRPEAGGPAALDAVPLKRWLQRAGLTGKALGERIEPPVSEGAVSQWHDRVPAGRREEVWAVIRADAPGALRRRRERCGLKQSELAQRVVAIGGDATQSRVSRWELGYEWPTAPQWELLDRVLESAPDRERGPDLHAEELDALLAAAQERGVSASEVARATGVNKTVLSLARHGKKPLAQGWHAALRRELVAIASRPLRNRVRDEVVPAVVSFVELSGWVQRGKVDLPGVDEPLVRRAIGAALEQRLIHEAPRVLEFEGGRRREYLGLVAGPRPRRAYVRRDPTAERALVLAEKIGSLVADRPGHTVSELAMVLESDVKIVRRALRVAAGVESVHECYGAAVGGAPRREWWPGKPSTPRPRPMSGSRLRAELEHRDATADEVAQALGVHPLTVRTWLRGNVPAARMPQLRDWLARTSQVGVLERDQAAQDAIVELVARSPGLTRGQISPRLAMRHRRRLGRALPQALEAGEVYYRPHPEHPSRLGLYPAPIPAMWLPRDPVTGAELLSLRRDKGWSQRELAQQIGVLAPRVCIWEKRPGEEIPRGWWARVHQLERVAPAEAPPPPPPPARVAERLRVLRANLGWDRVELALRAGVSPGTVARLESERPVNAETARRVLQTAGNPSPPPLTKPRSGAKLRAHREGAGVIRRQLAELIGQTQGSIAHYENGLIPITRARERELEILVDRVALTAAGGPDRAGQSAPRPHHRPAGHSAGASAGCDVGSSP
jgi:transcriptional regulator with XRE-family HTH domain